MVIDILYIKIPFTILFENQYILLYNPSSINKLIIFIFSFTIIINIPNYLHMYLTLKGILFYFPEILKGAILLYPFNSNVGT